MIVRLTRNWLQQIIRGVISGRTESDAIIQGTTRSTESNEFALRNVRNKKNISQMEVSTRDYTCRVIIHHLQKRQSVSYIRNRHLWGMQILHVRSWEISTSVRHCCSLFARQQGKNIWLETVTSACETSLLRRSCSREQVDKYSSSGEDNLLKATVRFFSAHFQPLPSR